MFFIDFLSMAGPGPWEEGGRGKVNLPECSNTPDRVGGFSSETSKIQGSGPLGTAPARKIFHFGCSRTSGDLPGAEIW